MQNYFEDIEIIVYFSSERHFRTSELQRSRGIY